MCVRFAGRNRMEQQRKEAREAGLAQVCAHRLARARARACVRPAGGGARAIER